MYDRPRVTVHQSDAPINTFVAPETATQADNLHKRLVQASSREAAAREEAYLRALNGPSERAAKSDPPPLREPVLSTDFRARIAALDERICREGLGVSRAALQSLGEKRFQELLERDHAARLLQRVVGTLTDLSSWPSVEFAFAERNALLTSVPRRKTAEVVAGAGADREAASRVESFDDLWKATAEPQSVRNVYAFHDAFKSLVFGQSMLERLSADGKVRSRLFAGGKGEKVALLNEWLAVLDDEHFKLTIHRPLWPVLAWLCNEQTPMPEPAALATEWLNLRAPSIDQLRLCEAVIEGFLTDRREWTLWDYVGRVTRQSIDVARLEIWRKELVQRFPAITRFHDALKELFWRPVSSHGHGHYEFDAAAHRRYLEREITRLLSQVSALAALAIEDTHPGATAARFDDWLLCRGQPISLTTEHVAEKLAAAFGGAHFNVAIEAIQ